MHHLLVFNESGICIHYVPNIQYHSGEIDNPLVLYLPHVLPTPYNPIGKTKAQIWEENQLDLLEKKE